MITILFRTAVVAALAIAALNGAALAQTRDTITLGVTLEPPHLDPTAGAAAAIDEIVYANVFEGLTRIDQNGAVQPQLATAWTISDGLAGGWWRSIPTAWISSSCWRSCWNDKGIGRLPITRESNMPTLRFFTRFISCTN